jgi:hypothetical protein
MGGVRDDATCHPHDLGHPLPGPDLAAEARGLGATMSEVGEAGELRGRQSPGGTRRRAMLSCLWTPFASTFHSLAHGRFADAQRLGHPALRPALLLEGPGLEPSSVFPVPRCGFHP